MKTRARNEVLRSGGVTTDYITFGNGEKTLIMIPGVADGLQTIYGMADTVAEAYDIFAEDYTVYVFSRRNELRLGYTSRDMAADIKANMDALKIERADIFGVSQGGTIAQYLAIDHPESVGKAVLAVTYARQNDTVKNVIGKWREYAETGDYAGLFVHMNEHIYTEAYLEKLRPLYPKLCAEGKPKSFERFIISATACLTHDSYDLLPKLTVPTLIIGGNEDKVVSSEASYEMAKKIPNCEITMYDGFGHGAFDEAPDFNRRMREFLLK